MCLAVPGKIVEIHGADMLRSGAVSFGGIVKNVNLTYIPEAKVGDYVIMHVGFAISIIDEAEAMSTYKFLHEMSDFTEWEEQR
jgi:hydrogenase expression/formation protein HypC